MNYKQEIVNRIENFESNQVFIANDFFDIAGYETVRSTLNRLVKDKKVTRILKGIYYKPKYIELIGEYAMASVDEVADAIARKYNWTIVHRETQPLIYLVYLRRYQQNGPIYQMEDMPVLMLVRQG